MKEGKHSDGENAQAHVTMRHTPSPSGKSQATHTSKTPTDDEDQMHEDEEIQHAVRNASKSAAKGAVEIDGQAWAENRKSSTMPTADHTTPTVKTKRDKIIDALENKYWQGLVGTFTVLALYGDDIRILAFFKEHDIGFYSLFFICLIIFSAELTAQSIAVEGYKWSFFFCLDLIATASLLPDIPWLLDLFVGMYSTSESEDGGGGGGDVGIARAGRAARVGTRAGRIVRLVKLVDVVRKINPADLCASPERKAELRRIAEEAKQKEKQKRVQASRLGKILADQTTRRVIVGVLSMMMVTPLLEYENTDSGPRFGLELLYFARSPCSTDLDFLSGAEPNAECMQRLRDGVQNPGEHPWLADDAWDYLVYEYATHSRHFEGMDDIPAPLLWLQAPNFKDGGKLQDITEVKTKRCRKEQAGAIATYNFPEDGLPTTDCPEGYCCWHSLPSCAGKGSPEGCPWRTKEFNEVIYVPPPCVDKESPCYGLKLRAKFLNRLFEENSAQLSMIQTTFIIFFLGMGSVSFSKDTQTFVVAPIEKMVNIVKQLADDPLRKPVVQEDGDESLSGAGTKKSSGQLETSMLETTILKIGGLLRVGFGEAGATIIGGNMASQDGELNIMVTGRKVIAIYGFCKISDFLETTECLLEEVMVFVNKIAKIVHTCVHEWHGAANKNIGDAFLCTWMLNDAEDQRAMLEKGITEVPLMSELMNQALIAFVKVIAECRRANDLAAYAKHPKIIPRFGTFYRVNMSFGLHVGWSIEGAIGSEHKIDASYLSPHVNIASRLESITKMYGVDIMMSEEYHNSLCEKAKARCRRIDRAKLKGTGAPMDLFAFDINREAQPQAPDPATHEVSSVIPPPEMTLPELLTKGVEALFLYDQDVLNLQEGLTPVFYSSWDQAFHFYIQGKWTLAADLLSRFSQSFPLFDGPTQTLLQYILSCDLTPPNDWQNFRVLRVK